MKYKAVLLDADDTVFDFQASERAAFSKTAEHFGFSPELYPAYHRINDSLWKALERGEVTKDRLRVQRYEMLAEEAELDYDAKAVTEYYGDRLAEGYFLIDGAMELLAELHGKVAVYLCTNGISDVQRKRIAGTGIAPYLDGVFISEELGAEKPSPAFYDRVFEVIPYKPSEVIALGDSLSSDIMGAHGYGIDSCHLNPRGGISDLATYTVKELKEFTEIIK